MKEKYRYEYTDTFGGEANFSWVKRGSVSVKSGVSPVKAVKRALGLTGIRCRKENMGDIIALYPAGSCTVAFIDPDYNYYN